LTKPLTISLHGVMLTVEVVRILKKSFILGLALLFAICSHLRPRLDFTVAGQRIDTACSIAAARAARSAALAAAEEILPGQTSLPEHRQHMRLSFRKSADSAPLLCDSLLCATDGILPGSVVYVDGLRLGVVENAESFRKSFAQYIGNTLPTWAKGGSVRGMTLLPRYTRAAFEVSDNDMIMLVTGLSPVMYYDGKGRVSPV